MVPISTSPSWFYSSRNIDYHGIPKNVLFLESRLSKNYLENNRKSSFFPFLVPNICRRFHIICIKTGWFFHYDFRIKNTTWQIDTLNKLLFLTKDVVHWVLTEYYVLVHAAFKIICWNNLRNAHGIIQLLLDWFICLNELIHNIVHNKWSFLKSNETDR